MNQLIHILIQLYREKLKTQTLATDENSAEGEKSLE